MRNASPLLLLFLWTSVFAETSHNIEDTHSGESPTQLEELHLCYFSLNHDKEFKVMQELGKTHNKNLKDKRIVIHEYMKEEGTPEENFRSMIEEQKKQGIHCDGLVISGHHTGAFSGQRDSTKKGLSVQVLEDLACQPEYADWFSNVNALWLQGCRTLGAMIVPGNENATDADFHANRVFNVRDEDHLGFSYAEMSQQFSETLDQSNPLSSRYLRTFPRASVFGWTATAPGKNAQSENSLPFFIAHLSRLYSDEAPLSLTSLKDCPKCQTESLVEILEKDKLPPKKQISFEEKAVEAWLRHGRARPVPGVKGANPLSFDNKDLSALPAATIAGDPKELLRLNQSQILTCALRNFRNPEDPKEAAKILKTHPHLISALLNPILSFLMNGSPLDLMTRLEVKRELATNSQFLDFLKSRISLRQVGLLKKIEMLKVLEYVTGEVAIHERQTLAQFIKDAVARSKNQSEEDRQIQHREIVKALSKAKLLDKNMMDHMLEGEPKILSAIINHLSLSKTDLKLWEHLLDKELSKEQFSELKTQLEALVFIQDHSKSKLPLASHRDLALLMSHAKVPDNLKREYKMLRGLRASASPTELRDTISAFDASAEDTKGVWVHKLMEHPGFSFEERQKLAAKYYDFLKFEKKLQYPNPNFRPMEEFSKELEKVPGNERESLLLSALEHCPENLCPAEELLKIFLLKSPPDLDSPLIGVYSHPRTPFGELRDQMRQYNSQDLVDLASGILLRIQRVPSSEALDIFRSIYKLHSRKNDSSFEDFLGLIEAHSFKDSMVKKDLIDSISKIYFENVRETYPIDSLNKDNYKEHWPDLKIQILNLKPGSFSKIANDLKNPYWKNIELQLNKSPESRKVWAELVEAVASKLENSKEKLKFAMRLGEPAASRLQTFRGLGSDGSLSFEDQVDAQRYQLDVSDPTQARKNLDEYFVRLVNLMDSARLSSEARTQIFDLEWFLSRYRSILEKHHNESPLFKQSKLAPESEEFVLSYMEEKYSSKKLSRQQREEFLLKLKLLGLGESSMEKVLKMPAFQQTPFLSSEVKEKYFSINPN